MVSQRSSLPGRRHVLGGLVALSAARPLRAAFGASSGEAQRIRIGAPAIAGALQVVVGALGIAREKGLFEQEFAHDNISFEFVGFPNASLVSQALASGQIDLAAQGDLISIIAHAIGVPTRLVLPSGRYSNAYLAVGAHSDIVRVEELRGRRVAYTKGNYVQLQADRILAAHGLHESDIRQINLSASASAAALAAGQVDAVFQGVDILALRDKGLAKIIYDTRAEPLMTGQSGIIVRDSFAQTNPEIVYRIIKVLVQAAYWGSDEAHRAETLKMWQKGRPATPIAEDYASRPMQDHLSPLLDAFFIARYEQTEREAQALGLLKTKPFDMAQWFDPHYLDRALRDLHLEQFWTPLGGDGTPLPITP